MTNSFIARASATKVKAAAIPDLSKLGKAALADLFEEGDGADWLESKYSKWDKKRKEHVYLVLWGPDDDNAYNISEFFVGLDSEGCLSAYGEPMPSHGTFEKVAEARAKFKGLK